MLLQELKERVHQVAGSPSQYHGNVKHSTGLVGGLSICDEEQS